MQRFLKTWRAGLALMMLLASANCLRAASPAESRAFGAATKAFEDAKAPLFWGMVETNFSDFIKKYPTSEYYAKAIVLQARAMFNQGKYDGVIELLTAQASRADGLPDQFAYWTAEAYFKKTNYQLAADIFARLVNENTNSSLRLEAIFREAEAHAKLKYWPRVIEELREPDGVFQSMAKTNQSNELVVRGLLLLSEAELEQKQPKEYTAAENTLSGMVTRDLSRELEWKRLYLLARVHMADGQVQLALDTSSNLLAVAIAAGKPELQAESILLKGEMYEQLEQMPAAISIYETNLTSDLPAMRRQALLKIVDLLLRQDRTAEAMQKLSDFLDKHPDEKRADFELLVLGELQLKQHYQAGEGSTPPANGTNLLLAAQGNFKKLVDNFPASDYLGKAELNLGWCLGAQGKIPESQASFSRAVEHLPFSEDQAVAQFKLADILYQQKDFPGAVSNYWLVIDRYGGLASVRHDLFERTLYQIVRASTLDRTNLMDATNAMGKILAWFPESELGERSMLLVGEAQSPVNAREVLSDFTTRFPQSSYLPEVKLALARTYEQEGNWPEAIRLYDAWVTNFPDSSALPRAEFSRAWANYKAGNETNAFGLFTNFVARFTTNQLAVRDDLPAKAQYWIGDFYFRAEDFQKAELSYKEIFSNNKWPDSGLIFEARMAAGRAAMGSQSAAAAITYFTSLSSDSNCPPGLRSEAAFAIADANMASTNSTNFSQAIGIFKFIATASQYTNLPISALAQARLGDCYFMLAASDPAQYDNASNAFARVMTLEPSLADASVRGRAELRLGQTLAAMAESQPDKRSLQKLALEHFTNILYENNLRDNESPDMSLVKEAGIEAGKLAGAMGQFDQAIQYYQRLLKLVPELQADLQKRIDKARENLASLNK